eukprot:CAMPEP_0203743006 /NCGR_PEP_ID=MMETSP0092-20131115/59217_1 /ASSEMBLY_ACC=CAM_ASM_001090 /TAXON_ID=426623 /ORGANISM="Chaetoceros affinis, Strain CCMP159" /LENGTH=513 /DNA_ID=CAMNT_0050630281 /DNA_START=407 /DNA_END=1944 /DNA_ORIENTATION=-
MNPNQVDILGEQVSTHATLLRDTPPSVTAAKQQQDVPGDRVNLQAGTERNTLAIELPAELQSTLQGDQTMGTSSSITSTTPSNGDKLIPSGSGDDFGHGADGKSQYKKHKDKGAATAGGLVSALRRRVSSLMNAVAAILSSSVKQRTQDPAGTISTKKRRPSGLKSDLDFDLDMNNFNSAGKKDCTNYMTRTTETDSSRHSSAFLSPLSPASTAIESVSSESNSICLSHDHTSTNHEGADECRFVKEQPPSHNHHHHHIPPQFRAEDVYSSSTNDTKDGANVSVPVETDSSRRSSAFLSPPSPASTAIESVSSESNSICLSHDHTSTNHEGADKCRFVKEQPPSHNHHHHHVPARFRVEDIYSSPTNDTEDGANVSVPVPVQSSSTYTLPNSTVKVAPLLEQIVVALVSLLVGGALLFHVSQNNKKHCYSGHSCPRPGHRHHRSTSTVTGRRRPFWSSALFAVALVGVLSSGSSGRGTDGSSLTSTMASSFEIKQEFSNLGNKLQRKLSRRVG